MNLWLYVREGCHLCDQARELIERDIPGLQLVEMDVDGNQALFERYDLRVPVLKFASGIELDWPFSVSDIRNQL